MDGMGRKLPRFVVRETSRHGRTVYYFRRGKGHRVRLPDFQSDDFAAAYDRALIGAPEAQGRRRAAVGTLAWLIERYRQSAAYQALSYATRRQRDNIFLQAIATGGDQPYRAISRQGITAARDKRAATPAQARNFLDAMRGLFRWALESEFIAIDPTAGVANPRRPKGAGFVAWTVDDVAAYERYWPNGTRELVWLHVLLYTGLRRGDAVRIGRQHVRDEVATIRTEKTGIEVTIPIRPELDRTLAAGPTGDLAWISGYIGEPLTKETFGNYFRRACRAAGLRKGLSAHGVRKLAATIAAEAGLSVAELEALFGWTGGTMASHYTKTANRKRLAVQASEKIVNAKTPHLESGAGKIAKN